MSFMLGINPVAGRRRPTDRKVVMGILDVFKHKAKDLTDQAGGAATAVRDRTGDLAGPAADAVNGAKRKMSGGLGSAGQYADAKTGRRYTQQIDGAVDKAQGLLGTAPRTGATGTPGATGTSTAPGADDAPSANADDPTDKLPRIHPPTENGGAQQ